MTDHTTIAKTTTITNENAGERIFNEGTNDGGGGDETPIKGDETDVIDAYPIHVRSNTIGVKLQVRSNHPKVKDTKGGKLKNGDNRDDDDVKDDARSTATEGEGFVENRPLGANVSTTITTTTTASTTVGKKTKKQKKFQKPKTKCDTTPLKKEVNATTLGEKEKSNMSSRLRLRQNNRGPIVTNNGFKIQEDISNIYNYLKHRTTKSRIDFFMLYLDCVVKKGYYWIGYEHFLLPLLFYNYKDRWIVKKTKREDGQLELYAVEKEKFDAVILTVWEVMVRYGMANSISLSKIESDEIVTLNVDQ